MHSIKCSSFPGASRVTVIVLPSIVYYIHALPNVFWTTSEKVTVLLDKIFVNILFVPGSSIETTSSMSSFHENEELCRNVAAFMKNRVESFIAGAEEGKDIRVELQQTLISRVELVILVVVAVLLVVGEVSLPLC